MATAAEIPRRDRRAGLWKCCFRIKSLRRIAGAEAMDRVKISSVEEDDGVVRLKMVIRRQELREMLAFMRHKHICNGGDGGGGGGQVVLPPAQGFQLWMNELRWRHVKRGESRNGRSWWTPALQSILEES